MLVATREIILEKLLYLPHLVDAYQRNEVGFVVQTNTWLQELEQALSRLRSPLTSLVARERARIVAALDGFREPTLGEGKMSRRRVINITTSQVLGEVEVGLATQLQDIDRKFDVWRDKLAQFISVASTVKPIPLPPSEPRREWLQKIWKSWQDIEDVKAMYRYLNTVMASADRIHLLGELLDNHLSDNAVDVAPVITKKRPGKNG